MTRLRSDPGLIDLVKKVAVGEYAKYLLNKYFFDVNADQEDIACADTCHSLIAEGELSKDKVLTYVNSIITTCTKEIRLNEQGRPMGTKYEDVSDPEEDFLQLQNTLHRHVCSSICFITKKLKNPQSGIKENVQVCRYNHPLSVEDETHIKFL